MAGSRGSGRVASNVAADPQGGGYAGNLSRGATPAAKLATAATSCPAASSGDRPWLGNPGLPCATGCAVKDHGGVPGPAPASRPARPRGCAQSAKWLWICGSGSSSVTVPCSHSAPALPAAESRVCWSRITGTWPWTSWRRRNTAGVAGPGDAAGVSELNTVVPALEAATGLRRALAPAGCLELSQAAEGNVGAVCTGP